MNLFQFQLLKNESRNPERVININDLKDKTPRTLLYGYTTDRLSWHVYINEHSDDIITVVYRGKGTGMRVLKHVENIEYVPNKRLYPETCDFEFCKLLINQGVSLPFTNWSDREPSSFYGEIY